MNTPAQPTAAPAPPVLRRYAGIYAALWKNSVTREMTFKTNFLLWIVVELCWFALQLCFITVLYQHTDHILDWSRWQVILLIGASHFVQEMFQAFFLINCMHLPEQIRTGKLDFFLLLPVNTRFILSLRQVDLGSFVNASTAVAVMVYALRHLGITPSLLQIIGFLILVAAGMLIHYSLMFLLASVSFWTVRAQGIVMGYYNLFNITRLPDSVFHGAFKMVFTFVLPVMLVANVPARLLADTLHSPARALLLLGMSVVCFVVSEGIWRFALKHYTSASS